MSQEKLSRSLIAWFERNARDLPWRKTADPYAIWVSEVMLQQTRVQTVIPYWERWMHRFPDVRTLAQARLDDVLKWWEGLGYYSRARNLQRAAQIIQTQHGGELPADFQLLLTLPGIGRYTAGAICSIAFHQPAPILDGNVTRVLTRLFGIRESIRLTKTITRLWSLAESFVISAGGKSAHSRPMRSYSSLNQSLMELGATICTPRDPLCSRCPVRSCCVAHRSGKIEHYPNVGLRKPATVRYFVAFAIRHRDRWLVRQRDGHAVNGFLWEFPNVEVMRPSRPNQDVVKSCLGCDVKPTVPLCRIKHTITRYRIQLDVFGGSVGNRKVAPRNNAGIWRSLAELDKLAFPSAHRKIVETLKLNSHFWSPDLLIRSTCF